MNVLSYPLLLMCMFLLALDTTTASDKDVKELQIGIKYRPEVCVRKVENMDSVHVHYSGRLINGKEFDSSYKRNKPLQFVVGRGDVIRGWDMGVLGMCVGEKRKLKIPPHLGYGDTGAGRDIPPKSTLIFDVELVEIEEKEK